MPHAPASVGREAKGLLRRQGSKSPSCLIGSIIAFNGKLVLPVNEIKLQTRFTNECEKECKMFRVFYALGAYMLRQSHMWTW